MARLLLIVILSAAVPNLVELSNHHRAKRTIVSGIRNWWYGTTENPVEAAPYYEYAVQYGQTPNIVDVVQDLDYDGDLGRLARELGLTNLRNLPRIEEVVDILGVATPQEAIEAIRDFARQPGGIQLIEQFLVDDESDIEASASSTNEVVVTRDGRQLAPGKESVQRFQTDAELVQKIATSGEERPSFFGRIGYWANFLNPFSGWRSVEVPLPSEPIYQPTGDIVTIMPPTYNYPEGYDPKTKTFRKISTPGQTRFIQPQIHPSFTQRNIAPIPISSGHIQVAPIPIAQNVPVAPFHINMNDGEFSPQQIEALRNQLYYQRVAQIQQQQGQMIPVTYQGQQFLIPNPPFYPAPVLYPEPPSAPVSSQAPPKNPDYTAPVAQVTPDGSYKVDIEFAASEQNGSILPHENSIEAESEEVRTLPPTTPEVKTTSTIAPETPEEDIVTTKEDQESEGAEAPEVITTKLSPVSLSEPRRLSLELSATGEVHKTDPEALESAINAVRIAPEHELAEKMMEMVTHLTTDPRNSE